MLTANVAIGVGVFLVEMLDVWSTDVMKSLGGIEANPLMAHVMIGMGGQWWLLKLIIGLAIAVYIASRSRFRWLAAVVLAVASIPVLTNGLQIGLHFALVAD